MNSHNISFCKFIWINHQRFYRRRNMQCRVNMVNANARNNDRVRDLNALFKL